MDVHTPHQHHAGRKRLGEYFAEGFMIFVAVTMGFLAENLREHLADREKEQAFMRAFAEDLAVDSVRLTTNIERLQGDIAHADTVTRLYIQGLARGSFDPRIGDMARIAGNSIDVVFNDRTASQLKGTGALRLIEHEPIATGILQYWNNQSRLAEIHDRFEALRLEHRKHGWRAFNWYRGVYAAQNPGDSLYAAHHPPMIADAGAMREFMNATSSMYNLANAMYLKALQDEMALAVQLRTMIHQRYP